MSDLIATIVVIFLSLAVVSLMLLARLRAGELSPPRTAMVMAQLWLTVGVIVALFTAMSRALGEPGAAGGLRVEVEDIGHRFAALDVESKWLLGIGAALAVGLFVHLLYSIARAMREAAPP